jgi:hypothetical protein
MSSTALLSNLLSELVRNYRPDQSNLDAQATLHRLPEKERDELRELFGEELCETGFGPDDEPNERGKMIESLIDWLGEGNASPLRR